MPYYANPYDLIFARPSSNNIGYVDPAQLGMNAMTYFTAAAMQGIAANPALIEYSIKELGEMAAQLAHETIQAMNNFTPPTP